MLNVKPFLSQCIRVWHLLIKPTKIEFTTVAKVSALGLGVIGLLGFIISVVMSFLNFD